MLKLTPFNSNPAGRVALQSASRAPTTGARFFLLLILSTFYFLLATFYLLLSTPVFAQDALTLTITPPLIQVNLDPGQTWTSSIRVVNGNRYEVTVYADPVPFTAEGEGGRPRIVLSTKAADNATANGVAAWLDVPQEPIIIGPEQTHEVPFTIRVPADAPPGGHYAAVLIGNKPGAGAAEGGTVTVSSSIASLLLLTVSGNIDERGRIRDFVTERHLYDKPEARFSLRFENQGNVHIQPQGDIVIYNHFGKERGRVTLGQGGNFGNVLPGSIRQFSFEWIADAGGWDIGRYRAEATFAYGKDSKRFASATTYFWVLPLGRIALLAGGLALFIWFIGWSLRLYVRRALALEAQRIASTDPPLQARAAVRPAEPVQEHVAPQIVSPRTYLRPIERGIVDLRALARPVDSESGPQAGHVLVSRLHRTRAFLRRYRVFFIFLAVVGAALLMGRTLLRDVLTYERAYEVEVLDPEAPKSDAP